MRYPCGGNRGGEQLWLSVCRDVGSLLHLDMFNSHPCAKSEILFNYINKVPCFAFWASSAHSQKIYIYIYIRSFGWKTRLVLEYCIRMDSGIISKVVHSESVRNKEGIEKNNAMQGCVSHKKV